MKELYPWSGTTRKRGGVLVEKWRSRNGLFTVEKLPVEQDFFLLMENDVHYRGVYMTLEAAIRVAAILILRQEREEREDGS